MARPSEQVSGSQLYLGDALVRAGFTNIPPPRLTLRKTTIDSPNPVEWGLMNFLCTFKKYELEQLFSVSRENSAKDEASAYCAAASAYLLERYEESSTLIKRSIKFDSNVEDYWYLLAFSLRQLGQKAEFERIVFLGEREAQRIQI